MKSSVALAFSPWTGVKAFTALALLEQFIVEALIVLAPSEWNAVHCIYISNSVPCLKITLKGLKVLGKIS